MTGFFHAASRHERSSYLLNDLAFRDLSAHRLASQCLLQAALIHFREERIEANHGNRNDETKSILERCLGSASCRLIPLRTISILRRLTRRLLESFAAARRAHLRQRALSRAAICAGRAHLASPGLPAPSVAIPNPGTLNFLLTHGSANQMTDPR